MEIRRRFTTSRKINYSALLTEKLIECVQKHPCLYDGKNTGYKNHLVTANAWKQVGREINETGDVAKKKWKSIRDNYMRYKKEIASNTGTGPGAKKFTKWPWVARLQFLEQNYIERGRKAKLKNASQSDTQSETSLPETKEESPEPSYVTIKSPKTFTDISQSGQTSPFLPECNPQGRITRSQGYVEDDATNSVPNKNENITQEFDAADHLFQSYAKTFKGFSKQNQINIKLEMAKLFAEIERKEHNLDTQVYMTDEFLPYVKSEPGTEEGNVPTYVSGDSSDSGASTSRDE